MMSFHEEMCCHLVNAHVACADVPGTYAAASTIYSHLYLLAHGRQRRRRRHGNMTSSVNVSVVFAIFLKRLQIKMYLF